MGSPSFVSFNKTRPVPAGFIFEHVPQHRPACIKHGFSHPGFCNLRGADIADDDKLVFASDSGARLMELILSGICDLGVDRLDAAFVARSLLNGERGFVLAIVLQGRNSVAVAARRECLQTEVDPDFAVASGQIVGDLTLETDIPATPGVLSKAAGLDGFGDFPRFPEMEFPFEIDNVRTVYLGRASDKRQPTESALGPGTGAKTRGMARGVARDGELFAYLTDRIGMQTEFGGATSGQIHKIEMRGPAALGRARSVGGLDLPLNFTAVVPDKINGTRMPIEMLPYRGVLDSILECQNHPRYILGLRRGCKWISPNIVGVDIPSLNWSVTLFSLPNTGARCLTIMPLTG